MLKALACFTMAATAWAVSPSSSAQTQLIVPFPPGGGTDLIARQVQGALAKELSTPVVVVNASGGSGAIAASKVLTGRPDGSTLLLTSLAPVVIQPAIPGAVRYRTEDFAPICVIAGAPVLLLTTPESGIRTTADLIAKARSNPKQIAYATAGTGGVGHLATVALLRAAGIELTHIPYRGAADALLAMRQGAVSLFPAEPNIAKQYGLHAIGVFGEHRLSELPDAPTMSEQGYPLSFRIWTALFAAAGTPEPVLVRLDAACERALKTPALVDSMKAAGQPITFMGRSAFKAYTHEEAARYKRVVEESGIEFSASK